MKIAISHYDDYRSYFRDVLEARSKKNTSLSLRSFARDHKFSPSYFSRILSGQRRLTANSAIRISETLGFQEEETAHLLDLVSLEGTPREEQRAKILHRLAKKRRGKATPVSIESFKVISDWYHFAIVSLTNTRGFQADSRWISKRLGISPLEAKTALDRLLAIGLLERVGKNIRAPKGVSLETPHDIASTAVQENHRQNIEKSLKALSELKVELREFANLTIAMRPSEMISAKNKIRKFIDSFEHDLEKNHSEELFQLNVQFYQLTQKGEKL